MIKKLNVIIIVSLVICLIFLIVYYWGTKISEENITKIVQERQNEGVKYIKLVEKDGITGIYDSRSSFPHKNELNNFIKLKYVERIAVFPNEYVAIYFKHPPKGYTSWGIYYQKDNKIKGYGGFNINEKYMLDENTYIFDGRKEEQKQKAVYETRRICTNWFFQKEDIWN